MSKISMRKHEGVRAQRHGIKNRYGCLEEA